MRYFYLLLIPVLLVLSGCPPPKPVCVKDGRDYCQAKGVFTYQWYDYYQRALSCMEGECYQEALSDLDMALAQKFDDERMARTYGMHLMDYFPHREKGLIYYLMKDYDAARQEFELSVTQYASAKAFFYLDKVRTQIMERDKASPSTPHLVIIAPSGEDEIRTRDDPVIISGMAEDRQYVSEILLEGEPIFTGASGQRVPFEKALTLPEGEHRIEITARNLSGRTAKRELIIHVDRSGPIITLTTFDPDVGMEGMLYDESGEISLFMNSEAVPISKGREADFSVPVRSGTGPIRLLAADRLGNETDAVIDADTLDKLRGRFAPAGLLAGRASDITSDAVMVLGEGSGLRSGLSSSSSLSSEAEIILTDLPDQKTVFSGIVSVRGQVSSGDDIEEVMINDILVHRSLGRLIFFNHSVSLKRGKNLIVIRAKERSGRETVKTITLLWEIPEVFKPAYRCVFKTGLFAIHAFDHTDREARGILFQHLFFERLMSRDRFRLRMENSLKDSLSMRNSDPGRKATPNQKELKMARFMLKGYVHSRRIGIETVAWVVDMKTTEILSLENEKGSYMDAYSEFQDISVLKRIAGSLSEKFHNAFPLVKGRITRKDGEEFVSTMEKGDIRMNWPLVVGSDTEFVGNAVIREKTEDGTCRIRLEPDKNYDAVLGNWVITE